MAGTPTTGVPVGRQELRIILQDTMSESFLDANAAGWNPGTANKLRCEGEIDESGIKADGIPDDTINTRMLTVDAPLAGLSVGTLKFKTYLGAGNADVTVDITTQMMAASMGAISSPTSKTADALTTTSTTTSMASTGIGAKVTPGQAMIVGARGDGRGGGCVRPIASESADAVVLAMAVPVAPISPDVFTLMHQIYLSEAMTAPLKYADALWLSAATELQRQAIGGALTFSIDGLKAGAKPMLNWELRCVDHQWVATALLDPLSHASAMVGNNPPTSRGLGSFYMGDASGTACTAYRASGIKISTGIAYEALEDPNGPNGIGGWLRLPNKPPRIEVVVPFGADMPGLRNDFTAGTAKKILYQLGHVATGCVAFYASNAKLVQEPHPVKMNNEQGLSLVFDCGDNYNAAEPLASALSIFVA